MKNICIFSKEKFTAENKNILYLKQLFEDKYGLLYHYEHDYFTNYDIFIELSLKKIMNSYYNRTIIVEECLLKYITSIDSDPFNTYIFITNDIFKINKNFRYKFDEYSYIQKIGKKLLKHLIRKDIEVLEI